ncbi:SGNH/GDSL hydrolase family protein [Sphingomonas quercus]
MLALVVAPCASAQAVNYSGLYVFGDSLVDAGNAFLATGGAEASPINGYYQGRFSNGYNFADYLSLAISGTPTQPALIGGTNVAVGGADAETKPGEVSPSFISQIGLYSGTLGNGPIASDALVLVTFGGNDVRDTIATGGAIDFTAAANDFATGLNLLYALGARNFVITGSPDIGLLPASLAATGGNAVRLGELTDRSMQISDLFEAKTAAFDMLAGVNASFFDLFGYEHDLLADPTAFGLPAGLDTTTPCQIPLGGSPQLANCANSLYFDGIHPTTIVHQAIAGAILAQLDAPAVPEPAAWLTMILGFGGIGVALRRQRLAMPIAA